MQNIPNDFDSAQLVDIQYLIDYYYYSLNQFVMMNIDDDGMMNDLDDEQDDEDADVDGDDDKQNQSSWIYHRQHIFFWNFGKQMQKKFPDKEKRHTQAHTQITKNLNNGN